MTNPTENPEAAAADHAATVSHLLNLVSEMRGLRDRAEQRSGRTYTFAEIAHTTTAGETNLTPSFHRFLQELAGILDTHSPQEADGELAKEWRAAVQAWMKQRS